MHLKSQQHLRLLSQIFPEVAFSSASIGNGNKYYADNVIGENGFIANIAVLNGDFSCS